MMKFGLLTVLLLQLVLIVSVIEARHKRIRTRDDNDSEDKLTINEDICATSLTCSPRFMPRTRTRSRYSNVDVGDSVEECLSNCVNDVTPRRSAHKKCLCFCSNIHCSENGGFMCRNTAIDSCDSIKKEGTVRRVIRNFDLDDEIISSLEDCNARCSQPQRRRGPGGTRRRGEREQERCNCICHFKFVCQDPTTTTDDRMSTIEEQPTSSARTTDMPTTIIVLGIDQTTTDQLIDAAATSNPASTTSNTTEATTTEVMTTTEATTTEATTTGATTTKATSTEATTTEATTTEATTTEATTTGAATTKATTTEATSTEATTTEATTTEATTTEVMTTITNA